MASSHLSRYQAFIQSRPKRIWAPKQGLCKHHILPKSLGGSNDSNNLIVLTEREHYIAHLMLWKAYGGKMAYAFWLMSHTLPVQSSRHYAAVRKDLGHEYTASHRANLRAGARKRYATSPGTMKGKAFSLTARQKMSAAKKADSLAIQPTQPTQWTLTDARKKQISEQRKKPVRCIETGEVFESVQAAGVAHGAASGGNISSQLRGKSSIAYGYHWERVNE
jgi:hypothetical protein